MQTEIKLIQCKGCYHYRVVCSDVSFEIYVETLEDTGREIVDLIQQYPDRQFVINMIKE